MEKKEGGKGSGKGEGRSKRKGGTEERSKEGMECLWVGCKEHHPTIMKYLRCQIFYNIDKYLSLKC